MKFPALITKAFAATLPALLLGAALALPAHAADTVLDPDKPRSLPAEGPVSVSWGDPAQFTDIRFSTNRWQAERGDWVNQLAEYVRKSATKQLQPGERLDVNITDIRRAGDYEPWHGSSLSDVRVIRDRYPPRMELSYTLYGSDGQVLAQGQRKLADLAFLTGSTSLSNSDQLRFEKRMIDDWTRRDLGPSRQLSSR